MWYFTFLYTILWSLGLSFFLISIACCFVVVEYQTAIEWSANRPVLLSALRIAPVLVHATWSQLLVLFVSYEAQISLYPSTLVVFLCTQLYNIHCIKTLTWPLVLSYHDIGIFGFASVLNPRIPAKGCYGCFSLCWRTFVLFIWTSLRVLHLLDHFSTHINFTIFPLSQIGLYCSRLVFLCVWGLCIKQYLYDYVCIAVFVLYEVFNSCFCIAQSLNIAIWCQNKLFLLLVSQQVSVFLDFLTQ